jgi:predicted ATPase
LDIDGGSLVDKGYGLTQLTAIILSISEAMKIEGTVILEEPETNLHPKFQSMLAEMMLYAKTYYDVSFIIETHSEYLIRKLQYLTAKKEIESKDTVIYYFHHPDEIPKGEKQIKKLTIRDDGMMDGDFGEGFFDESSRLTMDLLKMQNQN